MMTLGEKIKEQRKKLGYTQEALAERRDVMCKCRSERILSCFAKI